MNTELYDETYDAIVFMAKAKMIMNRHKGNIEDVDPEKLIKLVKSELAEIEQAMANGGDQVHVIEECADLMNYLVAMSHVAIRKYRERKNYKGHNADDALCSCPACMT